MQRGRQEARAVRNYLGAIRPPLGTRRPRSAGAIRRELAAVEEGLGGADVLTELRLVQRRRDLRAELRRSTGRASPAALEQAFLRVVAAYSERRGVSYATWRAAGVPAAVLKRAGIRGPHRR